MIALLKHKSIAQIISKLIPASCPFQQDIQLFAFTLHIPPLCKLNPWYDQLIALRDQAIQHLDPHS